MMITELVLDTIGCLPRGKTELLRAGIPVVFLEFLPGDCCLIELPDSRVVSVEADRVSSGLNAPEETISELAKQMRLSYNSLAKAARRGRILARKSGATWLTTRSAIEYALAEGRLQPRS